MLNIAVIGAGRIGTVHAASVAACPDARLTWVADPIGDGAQTLAQTYGAKSTLDAADVFAADDVDAVVIGSPTPFHVEHILAAVGAGKAALCEKPVDQEVARVDEAIAQLGDKAASVMLGFQRRFDPSFAAVKERILAGQIGDVQQVTMFSRDPAAPPVSYVAQSGGIFRDMTIHDFDMARFLVGDIVEVSAVATNFNPEIKEVGDFDSAVVTLIAASGALVTIVNNRGCAAGYDQRVEVLGDNGILTIENHLPTSVRFSGAQATQAADPYLNFFLERYTKAYANELTAFIDCVQNGTAPSPNMYDGRAAQVLADAAMRSAKTGERVRIG